MVSRTEAQKSHLQTRLLLTVYVCLTVYWASKTRAEEADVGFDIWVLTGLAVLILPVEGTLALVLSLSWIFGRICPWLHVQRRLDEQVRSCSK